jgi:ferredoxin
MPKVTFLNETTTVEAKKGQTIKEVAEACGIPLHRGFWTFWTKVICRDHGVCGSCRVWVQELTPGATSPKTFGETVRPRIKASQRLACRAKVLGDIEVRTLPGGVMFEPKQTTTWEQDPRPAAWKDRLAKANAGGAGSDDGEEADGEAKPAAKPAPKPAAAASGGAAAAPKPAAPAAPAPAAASKPATPASTPPASAAAPKPASTPPATAAAPKPASTPPASAAPKPGTSNGTIPPKP